MEYTWGMLFTSVTEGQKNIDLSHGDEEVLSCSFSNISEIWIR